MKMSDRDKSHDRSDELSLDELEQASGGKDATQGLADDELSIDELDIASGGTDAPPPDPDAAC
jgi:hypothetical protein